MSTWIGADGDIYSLARGNGTVNYPGGTDFWTYRNIRGMFWARLENVDVANYLSPFNWLQIHFEFVNSSGHVIKSATLRKDWGVMPAWTYLGTVTYGHTGALRIRMRNGNGHSKNIYGGPTLWSQKFPADWQVGEARFWWAQFDLVLSWRP